MFYSIATHKDPLESLKVIAIALSFIKNLGKTYNGIFKD